MQLELETQSIVILVVIASMGKKATRGLPDQLDPGGTKETKEIGVEEAKRALQGLQEQPALGAERVLRGPLEQQDRKT